MVWPFARIAHFAFYSQLPLLGEWFQFDVLKPAGGSVVLQTDEPALRMIAKDGVELVLGSVGATVGFGEFRQIHLIHCFTIQHDRDA